MPQLKIETVVLAWYSAVVLLRTMTATHSMRIRQSITTLLARALHTVQACRGIQSAPAVHSCCNSALDEPRCMYSAKGGMNSHLRWRNRASLMDARSRFGFKRMPRLQQCTTRGQQHCRGLPHLESMHLLAATSLMGGV
jgi:hypothetical protein